MNDHEKFNDDMKVVDFDCEFGEPDDKMVPSDPEKAYELLVDKIRQGSDGKQKEALETVLSDDKLHFIFEEGFKDNNLKDVRISPAPMSHHASAIVLIHFLIGLDEALDRVLTQDCSMFFGDTVNLIAPIVIYRKYFLLDGLKRWSQIYLINPEAHIFIVNLNNLGNGTFRILARFREWAAEQKVDANRNPILYDAYKMTKDEIRNFIEERIQDVCWKSLVNAGVCKDRTSAIEYLISNVWSLRCIYPPMVR